MEYNFGDIEQKWKKFWDEKEVYKVSEDLTKPKYYVLDMFPYPSGAGLHVGHPLGYVASDIYARYKRLKGFNVLHPMGYDAFGLPAEQYAIETGTHPALTTQKAIARYREQMDKIGFSFDWSREIKTCNPDYYKWTQWIFLQLFNSWYNREKNKAESIETLIAGFEKYGCTVERKQFDGNLHHAFSAHNWNSFSKRQKERILQKYRLAFRSYTEVNWCETLGCVLANDEVKDGKSERGGYPVTRKKMRQWSLRITEYADRLLEGLNRIDWSESLKDQQRNWIGKSEGCLLEFRVADLGLRINRQFAIEVFTTRIDTLFGVTFLVIAPEHSFINELTTKKQRAEMDAYLAYVKSRTDVERQQEKKITGCFTGSYAVHPFTGCQIPIWTAEYVLAGYGTGAIMAVPADDERDKKFAEKFDLPVIQIIDKSMHPNATIEHKVGIMINSEFLNGMEVVDAIQEMTRRVEEMQIGKRQINYKLRDASYSRQRYWGEPFPITYRVYDEPDSPFAEDDFNKEADIPEPVNVDLLPLELPAVDSFKPTGDGRSPLANNTVWVNNNYETDTMPGYAGSSWYWFRYMDPQNPNAFAGKAALDYWQNVDIYFGGAEHAVGHLLYSRFWHKVLFDLGYVNTEEPFSKLVNQGMITGQSAFIYQEPGTNIFIDASLKANYIKQGKELREVRVNTKYVSLKDELDINAFVADRAEYKDYEFKPDANSFICHREVEKMSKSKYNVVNPDDVIAQYGADCFRMFEMFLGPIEQSKPWDDKGISGVSNFLRKFWRLFYDDKGWKVTDAEPTHAEYKVLNKTLKKIAEDIERLSFNTGVSAFMIATNELQSIGCNKRKVLQPLLVALAPFAPFITEELWSKLGNEGSIHQSTYPVVDEKYLIESSHTYAVSINGKVRAEINLPLDVSQDDAKAAVLALEKVQIWTQGADPKKFIFVKGKIINVVV